ncbi:hypothetical protein J8273_7910 [Carpediemonas membranifera]|uniref:Ubiquitin-like domain-containing protein n=1 Tax=Carpediemonas membranifera TaxID=201153 RepID=A0A8J6AYS9_9EUKA|nr:hypothetical protein J8273_7910 [Carpediemonas membranifera]|eukprot:KAG9390559.1 hypothetical protein J8273_7910 [Carpediemonas membranifera]
MKVVVSHPDHNRADVFELDEIADDITIEALRELVTQRFNDENVFDENITDYHMLYGGCILFGSNKTLRSFGFTDGDRIATAPRFSPASPPPRSPTRDPALSLARDGVRVRHPIPATPPHASRRTSQVDEITTSGSTMSMTGHRTLPANVLRHPMATAARPHAVTPADPSHAREYGEWLDHQRVLFNQAAFDYMRSIRASRRRREAQTRSAPAPRGSRIGMVPSGHQTGTQIYLRMTDRPVSVEVGVAHRRLRGQSVVLRVPLRVVAVVIILELLFAASPAAMFMLLSAFFIYLTFFAIYAVDSSGAHNIASAIWSRIPFRLSQTSLLGSFVLSLFPGWSFVANAASIADEAARATMTEGQAPQQELPAETSGEPEAGTGDGTHPGPDEGESTPAADDVVGDDGAVEEE